MSGQKIVGKGWVQRRIRKLLQQNPDGAFTAQQLASEVYDEIDDAGEDQRHVIRRSGKAVAAELGWTVRRVGQQICYFSPTALKAHEAARARIEVARARLKDAKAELLGAC